MVDWLDHTEDTGVNYLNPVASLWVNFKSELL